MTIKMTTMMTNDDDDDHVMMMATFRAPEVACGFQPPVATTATSSAGSVSGRETSVT
jgi:hypothetical protein